MALSKRRVTQSVLRAINSQHQVVIKRTLIADHTHTSPPHTGYPPCNTYRIHGWEWRCHIHLILPISSRLSPLPPPMGMGAVNRIVIASHPIVCMSPMPPPSCHRYHLCLPPISPILPPMGRCAEGIAERLRRTPPPSTTRAVRVAIRPRARTTSAARLRGRRRASHATAAAECRGNLRGSHLWHDAAMAAGRPRGGDARGQGGAPSERMSRWGWGGRFHRGAEAWGRPHERAIGQNVRATNRRQTHFLPLGLLQAQHTSHEHRGIRAIGVHVFIVPSGREAPRVAMEMRTPTHMLRGPHTILSFTLPINRDIPDVYFATTRGEVETTIVGEIEWIRRRMGRTLRHAGGFVLRVDGTARERARVMLR